MVCGLVFLPAAMRTLRKMDPLGLPVHGSDMNRRVQRDGGPYDMAVECRAHRDSRPADSRFFATGFRVACISGYPASDEPLRLKTIGGKRVMAGKTLTFQVSAEHDDVWDENLRFSLIDNEVPFYRASIDPVTGEFTCRPSEVLGGGTMMFTVFVSDAAGIQNDRQSFKVVVERPKNRTIPRFPPKMGLP